VLCIESRAALGAPASRRLTGANIGNSQIGREIAADRTNFEEKIRLIVKASRRDAGVPSESVAFLFSIREAMHAIFKYKWNSIDYPIHLLWIALPAAFAVCIGEFSINAIYFREWAVFPGSWLAMIFNIAILSSCIELLFAMTRRLFFALSIALMIYSSLVAGNIFKLICFDNPIRPTDLQYLSDLRVMAKSFLKPSTALIVLFVFLAAAVLNVLLWKTKPAALSLKFRIFMGTATAAIIFLFFFLPSIYSVRNWLSEHRIELPESWQFEPRASARANGLLVELAMSTVDPSFERPDNYSRSVVERVARAYQKSPGPNPISSNERPPNVIMLVIESFMDPLDLGVHFTSDPIPTFHSISRQYSSGHVVVPVFGGTSANTEYELMTGLSMYFLPDSSCPYRQYLNQDIPSLPRELHRYGYKSVAIPADPPYLFNHRAAYRHLGFDRWIFPETDPNTPRSPDDEYASDEAIADAVIAESRRGSPFFIYAFTGGTHFPWEYPDYNDSPLDIAQSFPKKYRSVLKTYINSLNVADSSLKKLISYFEKADQKTVILVMGDHMPALTGIYDAAGFFNKGGIEKIQKRHRVPIAIWSNYPTPKTDFTCSANFIPIRLLQLLGLRPTSSFALCADLYSHFPVFSKYVQTADGRTFEPESDDLPFQQLIEDYHLINYDLLIGKQYALETPGWK
jgi:phosphoglycerol transferase MdoB-like AlkP superfamily enzyme